MGYLTLFVEAVRELRRDKATTYAAAISFYAVISIVPAVAILLWVGSIFNIEESLQGLISAQADVVAEPAQRFLFGVVNQVLSQLESTRIGILIILILVFGATTFFAKVQDSLNTIWKVRKKSIVRKRLLAFLLIVGGSLVLVAALFLNVLVATLGLASGGYVNRLVWFGVMVLLVAALFKTVPSVFLKWKDVWVGSVLTAALLVVGNILLQFFLQRRTILSVYGSFESVILFLLWLYFSALMFLFGAEVTKVYSRR